MAMMDGIHCNRHRQQRTFRRRDALQIGALGLLGIGMHQVTGLRDIFASGDSPSQKTGKNCIFIFLSGGLSQHDSFDMKPHATDSIRGEFRPIATKTPGLHICEHLPKLSQRSEQWSLCRTLTHGSNEHSAAHHIMLTGHSRLPVGFQPNAPNRGNDPSIASVANDALRSKERSQLPPVAVLPERLVHNSGRVIPGQDGGSMGFRHDPWFIEASSFHNQSYGAYPEFSFDHQNRGKVDDRIFQSPQLTLPHGLGMATVQERIKLLKDLNRQRTHLEMSAGVQDFDRHRDGAISLLTKSNINEALDVKNADSRDLDRYGRHSFGWSLLMARRLVAAGISLVQVNLGNDETWDTHGNAFPHLKNNLFPPTDQAVSALLDDLRASGELENTLIVMAGEFGRTPKITHLEKHYKLPGRDHWGALQSVWFAGGGLSGGNVLGRSDSMGAYPEEDPVTPEDFAATIYNALGIPLNATWLDAGGRPHQVYKGRPIFGAT